ncbi:MAG TPA: ABC transporter ATP-binding protein [Candidatus Methylomirabilis sp.]|nr:ABC transporter ATP-binding protein [Candidatus Methylomirabilis sp.]
MAALLEVEGLSKWFGGLQAVSDVSFAVPEGGIVGLIGPNGAGKSTLFDLLSGVQRSTGGRVRFRGHDVTGWSAHRIADLGMSRTFQKVRIFPGMTVLENAMVGAFLHTADPAEAQGRAEEALKMVDLSEEMRHRSTRSLTLVDRKRLEMARALCTHPSLLLLDEVLAGLNQQEISVALDLIRRLNKRGVTLIVVEHLLRVIMELSQRVLVMDYGQLIADGPPQEVRRNPKVIKAYIGGTEESHA